MAEYDEKENTGVLEPQPQEIPAMKVEDTAQDMGETIDPMLSDFAPVTRQEAQPPLQTEAVADPAQAAATSQPDPATDDPAEATDEQAKATEQAEVAKQAAVAEQAEATEQAEVAEQAEATEQAESAQAGPAESADSGEEDADPFGIEPLHPLVIRELEEQVVQALRTIYDPEIPVDIYELGLIYKINIDSQARAVVEMTLTSPACPVAGTLPGEVEMKVLGVDGIEESRVELVWDPPWSPDMMSEAAQLTLGFF